MRLRRDQRDHGETRPEFLLYDLHIFVNAGEDCGFDKVANVAKPLAAGLDFGTIFFA